MRMTPTSELSINTDILYQCVKSILKIEITSIDWQISPFSVKKKNFTTDGLYRIHGSATSGGNSYSWSLFLKIIRPESEEKNDPNHFNYWKREALLLQSGMLDNISNSIQSPQCYVVEEKSNTEIWLWMEEIKEINDRSFSLAEFSFIAHQIGLWHGEYATGKASLPNEEWYCPNWLASWVDGCDQYAPNPIEYFPLIKPNHEIGSMWNTYLHLRKHQEEYLQILNRLPRTLSHQDLSKQNMFLSTTNDNSELILIDWQYVSISGLGEDLGKMFGVALSQNDILVDSAWDYQEHLFNSYLEGLRKAGWIGNALLPRLGFCISVAYRSAWEMPKLIKLQAGSNSGKKVEIEKYTQIVQVQMKLADEAASIIKDIKGEI
jgi:hypothetical protein